MSMGGNKDPKEEHGGDEPTPRNDANENGHTGEGSASALAQVISQGRERHATGEADDAAGSRHA